jgi:hypothetical protein
VGSIGSIGSPCSALSIGSACSAASALSFASRGSLLSARSAGSIRNQPSDPRRRCALLVGVGAAVTAAGLLRR